jgi:hypothetical protein
MLLSECQGSLAGNVFGLCVVALNKNLKLTTTLDRAITQNPCYVPLNLETNEESSSNY